MPKRVFSNILHRRETARETPVAEGRRESVMHEQIPRAPAAGTPQKPSIFDSDTSETAYSEASYEEPVRIRQVAPTIRNVTETRPVQVPKPQRPPPSQTMIEIAPGVQARLRGAKETLDCIERDFYAACPCFGCDAQMFGIADAEYIICPMCRVVSPLGVNANKGGGVALGVAVEELFKIQSEILLRGPRR